MNRSTVWKIVKKFQETENTLDRPGHGRKRSVLPSTPQKHEGKAATNPSPKLQDLDHRSRCKQIYHAQNVERQSGLKPFKMLQRQDLTDNHVAKRAQESSRRWPTESCRTWCLRTRRNSTPSRWYVSKMTEFGLFRHLQRKGSSQDAKIRSLSWLGYFEGCLLPSNEFFGPCNRTLHFLTLPRSPSPGLRGKFSHS